MRGVFRFSTDLSPGAESSRSQRGAARCGEARRGEAASRPGKYSGKSATSRARAGDLPHRRGSHPTIAGRGIGNAYVTLSPPTVIDSTRPQLGHYFSNYNFRCAHAPAVRPARPLTRLVASARARCRINLRLAPNCATRKDCPPVGRKIHCAGSDGGSNEGETRNADEKPPR